MRLVLSALGLVAFSVVATAATSAVTVRGEGTQAEQHLFRHLIDGHDQKPTKSKKLNSFRQRRQQLSLSQGLRHRSLTQSSSLAHQQQQQQPAQQQQRDLQDGSLPLGIWMTRGYGYVIQVTQGADGFFVEALLEETATSCVLLDEPLEDAVEGIELVNNSTLAIIDVGNMVPYTADKIDDFQGACASGLTEPDGTVLQDFDILVQTFNEHYAYFQERGVDDWTDLADQARASLSVNSTVDELVVALEFILQPLQDAHVYAYFYDEALDLDYDIQSKPNSFFERLLDEYFNQTDPAVTDPSDYISSQLINSFNIVDGYLSTGLQGTLGGITWGSVQEDNNATTIGYINILGFGSDDEDAYIADLRSGLAFVQDADVLVIDTRLNEGGSDVSAVFAASHFAAEKTLAYTLQPVDGKGGFVEPAADVYMDPVGFGVSVSFRDKPIILLQSEVSTSAAETFALAMIQLPQVTTAGQPTAGAFSDTLVRFTPNGWEFSLSNEYVRAPNGDVYEGVGIPAQIVIPGPVLPVADRQTGVDSWLDVAFEAALNVSMAMSTPVQSPTTTAPTPMIGTTTEEPTQSPVIAQQPSTEMLSSDGVHQGLAGTLAVIGALTIGFVVASG